jgi:hypothetical protein
MLKQLEELARLMIQVWCEWEVAPAPGSELGFHFGDYSVTLKRDPAEEVFIPGENLAGAVYVAESEAVTA